MKLIKAGVIGASGYAGAELVRLLLMHPYAELTAISSQSYTGKPISELNRLCPSCATAKPALPLHRTCCPLTAVSFQRFMWI